MNAMYIAQFMQSRPVMVQRSEDNWLEGLLSLLMVIVLVAGVILVARVLVQYGNGSKAAAKQPLDLAKERYAKGEISKTELEEIRKELSK